MLNSPNERDCGISQHKQGSDMKRHRRAQRSLQIKRKENGLKKANHPYNIRQLECEKKSSCDNMNIFEAIL